MEWIKCSVRMPSDLDFVFVFDANSGRYNYVFSMVSAGMMVIFIAEFLLVNTRTG